jgi:hypothetical protein
MATVAQAHHSFSALFDASTDVAIAGIVREFQFKAPHAYIRVEVADEKGTVVQWELETTSPGQLTRMGITPRTLGRGDRVSATGNRARDGRPLMRLLRLTMPNGEEKRVQ